MLSLESQNKLRDQYRLIEPGWQPATEIFAKLVKGALNPSSLLLDIGCGRGGLIEQLDHPLSQIVGIDIDLLSLAEHRLAFTQPSLPRAAGAGQELPFVDNSFDIVIASWLLEHLSRPLENIREISRVLRPGGSFFFITPNKRHILMALNSLSARYSAVQDFLVRRFYGRASADTFPAYYLANTQLDLERLARTGNMTLEKCLFIGDPTYFAFVQPLFRLAWRFEQRLPEERRIHIVGQMKFELSSNELE